MSRVKEKTSSLPEKCTEKAKENDDSCSWCHQDTQSFSSSRNDDLSCFRHPVIDSMPVAQITVQSWHSLVVVVFLLGRREVINPCDWR